MTLKKISYHLLTFVLYFVIFYIFCGASVGGVLFPFAFSFMFALIWVNQKAWVVCPAFVLASLLFDFGFQNIISTVCMVFTLLVPYYIHVLLKKNMKIWEWGIFAGLSQLAPILFSYFNGEFFYFKIISMVVGVLFMFVSLSILEAIFIKGFARKLTVFEFISGGVVLAVLSDGLTPLWLGPFSFLKLFVSFAILVLAYCLKSYYAVFTAVILGFGSLVGINNPVYIAPFIIWAMAISMFRSYKKYLMPIALVLAECLAGFYFNLYYSFSPWQIAPVVVSCLIFLLIPNGVYDKIRSVVMIRGNRVAVKDVVNRNREVLEKRLGVLGEAFSDMEKTLKKISKKSLSEADMKNVLKRELREKVCQNCPERNRCFRAYSEEMNNVFDEISDVAFEKGKINVLDIPNFMNNHCNKVTNFISATNTLCMQYKRYSELAGSVDMSKLLVAEQLGGISYVLKNLANEVHTPISFDNVREEKILEELLFNDVVCDDVVVYQKDVHMMQATLLVRNEDRDKGIIPDVVGKICGEQMVAEEITSSVKPGWSTLSLTAVPKYDCTFGISSKTKTGSERSGDCHSVLKLGADKFMFAVCDGMGSGKKAEETSEIAINLVENFYKAGFSSDFVLSSVNKLLALQKEDCFSAIDICVVDLKDGVADLIKMGTPSCYVLGREKCRIIEGNALPLGIVKDSEPSTRKIVCEKGDYILLVSDGVADSFESDDKLASFLCEQKEGNPQNLSDLILEKALENNQGRAKDDMTVMVVKIF